MAWLVPANQSPVGQTIHWQFIGCPFAGDMPRNRLVRMLSAFPRTAALCQSTARALALPRIGGNENFSLIYRARMRPSFCIPRTRPAGRFFHPTNHAHLASREPGSAQTITPYMNSSHARNSSIFLCELSPSVSKLLSLFMNTDTYTRN